MILYKKDSIVISFIIPVFNVAPYLKQCIDSMLHQTGCSYEIILVDDGSNDGSERICDEYAKRYDQIQVYHQKNQGVSVARNQGMSLARGAWLCFIDGDDWIETDFVEKIQQVINPEYDIIFFAYQSINGRIKKRHFNDKLDHTILKKKDFLNLQISILNQGEKEAKKYQGIEGTPWAKLYRSNFIEENNLKFTPEVRKGQDGLFNIQAYNCCNVGCYSSQIVYNYRINETSVCRRYNPKIILYSRHLISEYQKKLDVWKKKCLDEAFDYFIVRQFMYCILLDFCHKDNIKTYRERKSSYIIEKKQCESNMKKIVIKNMKRNERTFMILIKYMPFWFVDVLVKTMR